MQSRPTGEISPFFHIRQVKYQKKNLTFMRRPCNKEERRPLNGLNMKIIKISALIGLLAAACAPARAQDFRINQKEYFENAGAQEIRVVQSYPDSSRHLAGFNLELEPSKLLDFPYLWQEGEYCMGGYTSWFMYMALAADRILNDKL